MGPDWHSPPTLAQLRDKDREIRILTRVRVAPVVISLGVGLLLGLAGPVAGKWENPACVAINTVFSGGWPWAGYAFLVGYLCRSKIESTILSSLGLTVGVVTYYLSKESNRTVPTGMQLSHAVPVGLEPRTAGQVFFSSAIAWGIAAFVLGAPLGLLGNLARVPGVGGLPFRLIVPLVAFCETSMRLTAEASGQSPIVGMTWNVVRVAAGVAALALVGHTVWRWWYAQRTHSTDPTKYTARRDVGST